MASLRPRRSSERRPDVVLLLSLACGAFASGCFASETVGSRAAALDASVPARADAQAGDAAPLVDSAPFVDAGTAPQLACRVESGALRCGAIVLGWNGTTFLNIDLRGCGGGISGIGDAPIETNGDAYFDPMPLAGLLAPSGQGAFPPACSGVRPVFLTDRPGTTIVSVDVVFP